MRRIASIATHIFSPNPVEGKQCGLGNICTLLCAEALVPKHSMGEECDQASRAGTAPVPCAPLDVKSHLTRNAPHKEQLSTGTSLYLFKTTSIKTRPVIACVHARERERQVRKMNHSFESGRRKLTDTFSQSNDTSLTWQIPSKML